MGNVPVWLIVLCAAAVVAVAVFAVMRQKGGKAAKPAEVSAESAAALAAALLKAVGGAENVAGVEHCATRLRFELKRYAVSEADAKAAGALGVVRPAKNVCQIQVGAHAPQVYNELKKLM